MSTPASERFNDAYENRTAPWVIGEPQPTIVALEKTGALRGPILDVGCGLGEHTISLTSLGYDVLGVDFAAAAVEQARANATAKGVDARFEVADATALTADGRYATVLDSALFHVFGPDERAAYVDSVHGALAPGGVLHLLALADTGRGFGPEVSQSDVRDAFGAGWELEALDATTYRGIVTPMVTEKVGLPVGTVVDEPAWLARVRRV